MPDPPSAALGSLLLTVGLVALGVRFASECVRLQATTNQQYARVLLWVSVVCGVFVVGLVGGLLSAATLATYILFGLQVIALSLLFPVARRSLSNGVIHSPLGLR